MHRVRWEQSGPEMETDNSTSTKILFKATSKKTRRKPPQYSEAGQKLKESFENYGLNSNEYLQNGLPAFPL